MKKIFVLGCLIFTFSFSYAEEKCDPATIGAGVDLIAAYYEARDALLQNKAYEEARDALPQNKAYDEARVAYDEAKIALDEAWAAYYEAREALPQRKAYDEAKAALPEWREYEEFMEVNHGCRLRIASTFEARQKKLSETRSYSGPGQSPATGSGKTKEAGGRESVQ